MKRAPAARASIQFTAAARCREQANLSCFGITSKHENNVVTFKPGDAELWRSREAVQLQWLANCDRAARGRHEQQVFAHFRLY